MRQNPREHLAELAAEAMQERGLEPEFPPAAMAQLAAISARAPERGNGIRDLTKLLWCSIDNDDSRDLDQLTVSETLPGGDTRILVAIADVDTLVGKDTPIDKHAQINMPAPGHCDHQFRLIATGR